ncbi:MAG TPA: hypothetical protein VNZ53_01740 [Steroidobacteraceae bacterium]|nr:hypothetical protein [Steroidobacteraceae bacterium]
MQGKLLAAARGQAIQIKAARPALIPLQRLQLRVVAEIPDEITGARLRAEQTGQRLDAVSIDQQHMAKLIRLGCVRKILKRSGASIISYPLSGKRNAWDHHYLPCMNTGVSVLEHR